MPRHPGSYNQVRRLEEMMRLLASRAWKVQELARELRVDRRQVYRDLDRIEEDGHPLCIVSFKVTQRVAGKAVARWLPLVGALAVGGYAYYDTLQVGKTAMDVFKKE